MVGRTYKFADFMKTVSGVQKSKKTSRLKIKYRDLYFRVPCMLSAVAFLWLLFTSYFCVVEMTVDNKKNSRSLSAVEDFQRSLYSILNFKFKLQKLF